MNESMQFDGPVSKYSALWEIECYLTDCYEIVNGLGEWGTEGNAIDGPNDFSFIRHTNA